MPAQVVRDMSIDEVSLVDRPANQFAAVVIAKRDNPEDTVADYFDADGKAVDIDQLAPGAVVQNADGDLFEIEAYANDAANSERELESVGKSAFFAEPAAEVSKSVVEGLREELSKAVTDADERDVITKAFTTLEKRAEAAEARIAKSEAIAKSERDLRLESEYIAKADEYNSPVPSKELGPVLKRAAEALSFEDCAVINKALTAAGAAFKELGRDGQGGLSDPFDVIEGQLDDEGVAKSDRSELSKAQRTRAFLDDNPDAYDAYRAELANR